MKPIVVLCAMLCASAAHAERFKYPESDVQQLTELIGRSPELLLPGQWSTWWRYRGTGPLMWAGDTLYVASNQHKIEFEWPCSAITSARFEEHNGNTVIADVIAYGQPKRIWIYTTWPDGAALVDKLRACAQAPR